MKKFISTFSLVWMFTSSLSFAQLATDFSVNDCKGVNHNLFNELDQGKVIVLAWIMPCGSCVAPALSAYSEIQNYSKSNPDKINFYLVDDYANTSCATLTTWANKNGMPATNAIFSNNKINMSNYGSTGMPKIVVIGGTSHTVYFNQNNELNASDFNASIINALSTTNTIDNETNDLRLSISPNPVLSNTTTLAYFLKNTTSVEIKIINSVGQPIETFFNIAQDVGFSEFSINTTNYPAGFYTAVVKNNEVFSSISFMIFK